MHAITIELTDEAYESLKEALVEHEEYAAEHSVRSWIEHELNDNTDAIIEMLLSDF